MLAPFSSADSGIMLGASTAAVDMDGNAEFFPYDLSHVNDSLVNVIKTASAMAGKF